MRTRWLKLKKLVFVNYQVFRGIFLSKQKLKQNNFFASNLNKNVFFVTQLSHTFPQFEERVELKLRFAKYSISDLLFY